MDLLNCGALMNYGLIRNQKNKLINIKIIINKNYEIIFINYYFTFYEK